MQVRDIMTPEPACCTAQATIVDAAKMMVECDCGEIPVVTDNNTREPVGVITDRDIVCRTIAKGLNPLELTVEAAMTSPAITVSPEDGIEDCCNTMERNQIRRVPVVDNDGSLIGIV